ncbi:MAG TPA: M24 family metallopeptidase [Solirubrobacteraceae bacterium]|nr:M24 family metallopeptidase [Solirubrobacteraceae bacterium]
MRPDLLVYGDTLRSPALRHEVPLAIGDPFLFLETGGLRAVVTNVLEDDRVAAAAPDLQRLQVTELGFDELIAEGRTRQEVELEVAARAVARLGIRAAAVPPEFPVALADRLRAGGVELRPDAALFEERRRRKTAAELAGIRRAADAGMAAMREAARLLREARPDGDVLRDAAGDVLTSEGVRARLAAVCAAHGAQLPADVIVAPMGPGDPVGHDAGSGRLPPHTPLCVDLWPQDEASGCWADMTRTFVVGDVADAVAELHTLVLEAHERSLAALRPGVPGVEAYGAACDVFEAAGHPTQRTKRAGERLAHGFFFSLGHGVGLEVHEAPALGRTGHDPLVAGDVVAVEPGVVVPATGGMRVEDLVVVGEDGNENLTAALPYALAP